MTRSQTFAALRHPNYRLWFRGQMVSLFGTWMQTTAQGFLVYELTRSPAYLGYVGFAAGAPSWFLTLYGGVVADRVPRRTLLIITQTSMMLLAFLLAGLTFLGLIRPWHIVVLALCLGIANAFDSPARQAFAAELVHREDLTNAIALNAIMFNTGTAVGPAAAGITYAALGPAWCFALNGVSFLAVIGALLGMRIIPGSIRPQRPSALEDLKDGIRYVAAQPVMRTLVGLVAAISLFGISMNTLMPAWAVSILGGDEFVERAAADALAGSSPGTGDGTIQPHALRVDADRRALDRTVGQTVRRTSRRRAGRLDLALRRMSDLGVRACAAQNPVSAS
ncbi:MAG: MFS transporter [Armatimonadota bacterium]